MAGEPGLDDEARRYWRLVARIAARRLDLINMPDVATIHDIENQWASRRGQMIR